MFGFNNAEPVDVGEANAKLREDCPGLLLEVIIKRHFVNFCLNRRTTRENSKRSCYIRYGN